MLKCNKKSKLYSPPEAYKNINFLQTNLAGSDFLITKCSRLRALLLMNMVFEMILNYFNPNDYLVIKLLKPTKTKLIKMFKVKK